MILFVQVGAVKIYVAAVEAGAQGKWWKTGQNSVYHQNWWKS
jgi:hypothetical protein